MAVAFKFLLLLLLSFAAAVAPVISSPSWLPNFWLKIMGSRVAAVSFEYDEATIAGIQEAFDGGRLTSVRLVQHYLDRINSVNPSLHAVQEVNPDALADAVRCDAERATVAGRSPLHGIPILIKDNISTRDRLNTTSGSFALLGSVVPRDAGVIDRLRRAGAILLGKATMSEWDHFRAVFPPQGWSPRGGQGKSPYPGTDGPCGTSSGSAIAVAANIVTVALGTDLDGAITCPSLTNSVVGIKPTVGLTSRSGVVPISYRLDTVGPMARTVADAAAVLDVITGFDARDSSATRAAEKFIPAGGFRQLLNAEGLKGKRIGILSHRFDGFNSKSVESTTFARFFDIMREKGATIMDGLEMHGVDLMEDQIQSGEVVELLAEFKVSLEAYLADLVSSPVRTLADIIAFNNQHPKEEKMEEFGQVIFTESEKTNGVGPVETSAINKMIRLSKEGMEMLMAEKGLDALLFPNNAIDHALAIGGFPIISVPAGYAESGAPFGVAFTGFVGSDAKLIEIAYAFEQATRARKPPPPPLSSL